MRQLTRDFLILFFSLLVFGCTSSNKENYSEAKEDTGKTEEESSVIKITTQAFEIDMPDTLKSGWNTFNYDNQSAMTHLLMFEKMPVFEGKQMTIEDSEKEVFPAFQAIMDSLIAGSEPPYGMLPQWQVEYHGGTGLIGPRSSTEITINLQPGVYVVECYVKNPGGDFHSVIGMATQVVVTSEQSNDSPPASTINVSISATDGISAPAKVSSGNQIVEVNFLDQAVQENFLGVDVHVVDLNQEVNIDSLELWMDWMVPEGLQDPAPAKFYGGIQDMPANTKGYFNINLSPGKYAWISEVPNARAKGLYKEFVVE